MTTPSEGEEEMILFTTCQDLNANCFTVHCLFASNLLKRSAHG